MPTPAEPSGSRSSEPTRKKTGVSYTIGSLAYFSVIALVCILVYLEETGKDPRAVFYRCEESVLGTNITGGHCPYPSKVMKVDDNWICSCRSEAETRKGITGK